MESAAILNGGARDSGRRSVSESCMIQWIWSEASEVNPNRESATRAAAGRAPVRFENQHSRMSSFIGIGSNRLRAYVKRSRRRGRLNRSAMNTTTTPTEPHRKSRTVATTGIRLMQTPYWQLLETYSPGKVRQSLAGGSPTSRLTQ